MGRPADRDAEAQGRGTPGDEIRDATGRVPNLWFGDADGAEATGQRFHVEVYVAPEVAEQRIAAAVAAGGTVVDDSDAPALTVVADQDGNRGVVCAAASAAVAGKDLTWPPRRRTPSRPQPPQTWPAFDAMVQRHNGIFGGCWCIWFHPDGPERGQGAEANRALKKAYVEQGKAHAALVMDGDEAVAWAEYGILVELPTLHHRKESTPPRRRIPTTGSPASSSTSATGARA